MSARSRSLRGFLLFFVVGVCALAAKAAPCVSFADAEKHIGATRCVTGKVLAVKQNNGGVHFFDFCENPQNCPFMVVVFPSDLKQVGDVRQLQGKMIEIEGEVKGYDGRAEIVLRRLSQLRGDGHEFRLSPKSTTWSVTENTAPARSAVRERQKVRRARSNRRR